MPRILLIDDSETMRRLVARVLISAGFDVVEAGTGSEGLEVALQQPPVAAIVDVEMPGLNGIDTIQAFRDDASLARLPLIAYSGNDSLHQVISCLRAGADAFLAKDSSLKSKLITTLAGLLPALHHQQAQPVIN